MTPRKGAAPQGPEGTPDRQRIDEVLKTRADELAAEHADSDASENLLEVLEFILSGEHYGIESLHIREVYPMKDYTPIPGTPSFVLGLISIRGQILSIVDIRRFFDLPVRGLSDLNRVIVVEAGQMEMGILADRIVGVRSVPTGGLHPPLPTLTGIRSDYLRGLTPDGLIVLDVQKMAADPKIIVNEEVE